MLSMMFMSTTPAKSLTKKNLTKSLTRSPSNASARPRNARLQNAGLRCAPPRAPPLPPLPLPPPLPPPSPSPGQRDRRRLKRRSCISGRLSAGSTSRFIARKDQIGTRRALDSASDKALRLESAKPRPSAGTPWKTPPSAKASCSCGSAWMRERLKIGSWLK